MREGVFLVVFWFFGILGFFLCSIKSPQKVISCNFRCFSSFFVPPEALSFKSFSSSCCVFFPYFSFCLPFQKSIFFFAFCPSTPFWKTFLWGVGGGVLLSFFFCCLFLCQCLLVSLKQTFLTSPFSKPTCFSHWLFLFFSLFYFCFRVLCFCFSDLCWLCFGFFFFCFVFLVLLSDYEKNTVSMHF